MAGLCDTPTESRRRHFWATQPSACGSYNSCGDNCGIPGLAFTTPAECAGMCSCECVSGVHDPECIAAYKAAMPGAGLSFATNDWVRSLLLNIFNTVARRSPSECGNVPGQQGGHWSESYGDGVYVGTRMYATNTNLSVRSISEAIKLLTASVQADAYKLVTYGVATSVSATSRYLGNLRVSIDVDVIGPNIVGGRVNLKAQRLDNKWVWEA